MKQDVVVCLPGFDTCEYIQTPSKSLDRQLTPLTDVKSCSLQIWAINSRGSHLAAHINACPVRGDLLAFLHVNFEIIQNSFELYIAELGVI
jgi:hypothetical protein